MRFVYIFLFFSTAGYADRELSFGCLNLKTQFDLDAGTKSFVDQLEAIDRLVASVSNERISLRDFQSRANEIYQQLKKSTSDPAILEKMEQLADESFIRDWQEKYPDGWTPELWANIHSQTGSVRDFFKVLPQLKPHVSGDLNAKTIAQITNNWANLWQGYHDLILAGIKVPAHSKRLRQLTYRLFIFRVLAEHYSKDSINDNLNFLN
jgi:hypothetical protein